VRESRTLRARWRGLETESRSGLHGHERGNPGHRQGYDLTDHRASPRPYQGGTQAIGLVGTEDVHYGHWHGRLGVICRQT
jgi:hypothetical protein